MTHVVGVAPADAGHPESQRGPPRQLVAVGGSAGAIEPLRVLLRQLSTELPIALVVAVHTRTSSYLAAILRATWEHVVEAADELPLRAGCVYIAPGGCHLVVERDRLRLTETARVNRVRPAVDVLFRSAADVFGRCSMGVVLSGNGDDGSGGLAAVRRAGGMAFVQDPGEALFPAMPTNAIEYAQPDSILPAVCIGREIARLSRDEPATGTAPIACSATCLSLRPSQMDDALSGAVDALEQRAVVERRLGARFEARGESSDAAHHSRQAEVATRRADALRAGFSPSPASQESPPSPTPSPG